MTLEHVAIWTKDIERLKQYYEYFFGGKSNNLYVNHRKNFSSYFVSFEGGARLEIMSMAGIPENKNDRVVDQHEGIIHLAFGVNSMEEVDVKAEQLRTAGFAILSGPRKTGDGYYEFETLDPDGNRLEVTTVAI
jgi:lactoylglutathione lyase